MTRLPGMFLPQDIVLEYRIERVTIPRYCIKYTISISSL